MPFTPVWAAHVAARDQQLLIDLGAPLAGGLVPSGKADGVGIDLSGGPSGALAVIMR